VTSPDPRPDLGPTSSDRGLYRRAIDAFLPQEQRLGEERLERASMVAGVCVTIAVVVVPLVVVSWWSSGPNITAIAAIGVALAMLAIGLLQRLTGRVTLAGSLVPVVLLVVLAGVGLHRGGLGAVNLICYPFVPLVAGFLVGRRGAMAATAGVSAVVVGFWTMHHSGHVFDSGYTVAQRELIAAVGTVLMSALVMGITLLYEDARARARRLTAGSLAELRRRGVDLEEAREGAEAALRTKGEFLARVSHELRTPLNGVLGMTELLLGSGLSAEQREFARDSRRSAKALLALVNDLLDFSKLESGTVELKRAGMDPRTPAEDAVGVLSGAAQRKGLELVLHVDRGVPRWILGDADRVRQVLLNLVGNGVKYTDSGQVVVRLRRPSADGPLRYEVQDTGVGLPDGPSKVLFEPFSQADPETNRRLGGVGLGLAICHQLVRRFGGRIGADRADVGSCFWFTLPVQAPEAPPPMPPVVPLAGRVVVVVDDVPEAGEATAALLRDQGAAPEVCQTVDGALRLMRSSSVDLVVADTVMPDRDALSLLKEMAADSALRHTPVILSLPYGQSIDLSDLQGLSTERVRRPIFEVPLLTAIAATLGLPRPNTSPGQPLPAHSSTNLPVVDGGGARVLVVDDNDVGRRLAKELLTRLGFSVAEARDGREAVEAALSERFAVILMDCRMPEMDGYEATRVIREAEAERGERSSIVAVTAHAQDDERERCLSAGMDDYLTKPFRPADLAKTVMAWVKPSAT
jgi:two-component system, sensor histidine kinase and response regulator